MRPSIVLTRALRAFLADPAKNVVSIHANQYVAREAYRAACRLCDDGELCGILRFSAPNLSISMPNTGARLVFVGAADSHRWLQGIELGSAWTDDFPCADPIVRSRIR